MKISQLYTYPIKSFRAVPLSATQLTPHGFPYDRRFMLFKVSQEDTSAPLHTRLTKMTVTYFPEMGLFLQTIDHEQASADVNGHKSASGSDNGTVTVTYSPPDGQEKEIVIPLRPPTETLEEVYVILHNSPTKAFNMGSNINEWFSACFGFETMLVYLGPHLRPVLGNLAPRNAAKDVRVQPPPGDGPTNSRSWLGSIASYLPSLRSIGVTNGDGLTFADCAPYLVITEESVHEVSSRLPEGMKMDLTKFRANIVLTGTSGAYEEDFWGAISIKGEGNTSKEILLTQNCMRCQSLNIDYKTGRYGTGEEGQILKKLMKDRRVDEGKKWSPVFGRYGFLGSEEGAIKVGDEVMISKRNSERTKFYWPGL